jgi:pimeloyl-ACP methyl ester carboxylesterase
MEKRPVIVILHGWGSSSRSWEKVAMLLEEAGFSVYVPNLPGFGGTKPPKKNWGVGDYGKWVSDYIETINQDNVILLGHSFGGRISIKMAAEKYCPRVSGLILVGAAGIRHFNTREQAASWAAKKSRMFKSLPGYQYLRWFFYRFILRKKDYYEARGIMREILKRVVEEDMMPYLEEINIPTLLVWGERDKMTPLSDGYLMSRKITGSSLKIIPQAGHAVNLEKPEELVRIIINSLSSNYDG